MKKLFSQFVILVVLVGMSDVRLAQDQQLSPLDELPLYITRLTDFGQRADCGE